MCMFFTEWFHTYTNYVLHCSTCKLQPLSCRKVIRLSLTFLLNICLYLLSQTLWQLQWATDSSTYRHIPRTEITGLSLIRVLETCVCACVNVCCVCARTVLGIAKKIFLAFSKANSIWMKSSTVWTKDKIGGPLFWKFRIIPNMTVPCPPKAS